MPEPVALTEAACPSCEKMADPVAAASLALLVGLGHDGQAHRVYRTLLRHGIKTLARLAAATDEELLELRNLGPGMLARIRERAPAPCGASRVGAEVGDV